MILNKIFSITKYGDTHYLITIIGIKIKIPKHELVIERKNNIYNYYKKHNIDITTLPAATGFKRDIQLCTLSLLKELDFVCKENKLKYWLDFGTLLGAVRHKGFIPWDDDVDTGMMRKDYEKIIDAFKKSSRNKDIYADYVRSQKNPCQYYIRVQHKKIAGLYVDIFPYDYYGKKLTQEEQFVITKQFKNKRKEMNNTCDLNMSNSKIVDIINNARKLLLQQGDNNTCDLVWGIDFNHGWSCWLYSHDTIFPLKTIKFEGYSFPCINDTDKYLKKVYNNYMAYPKKISVEHCIFDKVAVKEYVSRLQ